MPADDLTILEAIPGSTCWSAAAGLPRSWLVVLDFGERVRRSLRLANPTLSFEQRTFEGSAGVAIEACWRLDGPDAVIVSCLDVRSPTDRIQAGLGELEGRRVVSAEADRPAHDLVLRFEGDMVLRAFVLEPLPPPPASVPEGERPPPPPPPPRRAWTAWSPAGTVVVGPHGRLGDPRAPRPAPPSPTRLLEVVEDDPGPPD